VGVETMRVSPVLCGDVVQHCGGDDGEELCMQGVLRKLGVCNEEEMKRHDMESTDVGGEGERRIGDTARGDHVERANDWSPKSALISNSFFKIDESIFIEFTFRRARAATSCIAFIQNAFRNVKSMEMDSSIFNTNQFMKSTLVTPPSKLGRVV